MNVQDSKYSTDLASLGFSLKKLRKSLNLTQSELGKIIDSDQTAVSKIETGHKSITLIQLITLSNHLDIPIDSILSRNIELSGSIKASL